MNARARIAIVVSTLTLVLALSVGPASAIAPTATMGTVSDVSYTTAHVKGTIDPGDQTTYYTFEYRANPGSGDWSGFLYEGPVSPGGGPQEVTANLTGLKPSTEYEVRLVADNLTDPKVISAGPNPTFTTDGPVTPASVTIDPVTAVTDSTAHFSGSIDPEAPAGNPSAWDVNWRFECTPGCPGLGGSIPADSVSHTVEADVTGLEPNKSYEVRLIAENAGGPANAGPQSFKTAPVDLDLEPLDAALIDTHSALIGALVNPRNAPVTYQFEWGTDTSYGNLAPASPQALGVEDNAFHLVSLPLSGLQQSTTYHYRVVATNTETSAVATGADRSFVTLGPATETNGLPDGRAYERVSPLDKASGDIRPGTSYFEAIGHGIGRATASGDAVTYYSLGSFAGSASAGLDNQFLSRRGPTGWTTKGVNLPIDPTPDINNTRYQMFSENLTGVGLTTAAVNPGDPAASFNLYRREESGGYQLLSPHLGNPIPPYAVGGSEKSRYPVVMALSSDASHVLFHAEAPYDLLPGENSDFYEFANGNLRDAAILPDSTPAVGCAPKGVFEEALTGSGFSMSRDGQRIYFSCGPAPGVYMREGGTTTPVGLTEVVGEPQPSVSLLSATPDGRAAFVSSGGKLTNDSGGEGDLYRWRLDAPPGSRLVNLTPGVSGGAGVVKVLNVSTDGRRVYYLATASLTADASPGNNVYLWEEGAGNRLVATIPPDEAFSTLGQNFFDDDDPNRIGGYSYNGVETRATPDGRRLIFRSAAQLTAYDVAGLKQIYMYDAPSGRVSCISCNQRRAKARKRGHLNYSMTGPVPGSGDYTQDWTRNVSDDGSRIFFDSSDALVPEDTNGRVDVYEWEAGRLYLISSGSSSRNSMFQDASASGDDVFFTTGEQLVRSDTDGLVDLYDARVGAVTEPVPIPGCVGDECQGTPSPPPLFDNPSSSVYRGPGNEQIRHKKQKAKHKSKKRKRHRAKQRSKARDRAHATRRNG